MNKILTTILISLLFFSVVYAQEDAGIGVQAGMNVNTWYGRDIKNLSDEFSSFKMGYHLFEQGTSSDNEYVSIDRAVNMRVGYHAGFEINTELTYFIWLKHEFMVYSKGFSYTGNLMDANGNIVEPISMSYRSYHVDVVPAALDFHLGDYQFFAGPYFSIMFLNEWVVRKGKTVYDYAGVGFYDMQYKDIVVGAKASDTYGTSKHEKYVSRSLQNMDVGLIAGIEKDLPHDFNISLFIKQGILSQIDTPKGQDRVRVYNRSLNFAVGYMIGGHNSY